MLNHRAEVRPPNRIYTDGGTSTEGNEANEGSEGETEDDPSSLNDKLSTSGAPFAAPELSQFFGRVEPEFEGLVEAQRREADVWNAPEDGVVQSEKVLGSSGVFDGEHGVSDHAGEGRVRQKR